MKPGSDRRTRKKLATHRALATAARELTLANGLDGVTVEDIANAADVSARTFFNYFSSKEEAVVGVDQTVLTAMSEELVNRPADEDPLTALLAVLVSEDDSEFARRWRLRTELSERFPELVPRFLAALVDLEQALTISMAVRLDTDPETDPYPQLVVAWAVATLRSTMAWWLRNGQPISLHEALRNAFHLLDAGPGSYRARRDDDPSRVLR